MTETFEVEHLCSYLSGQSAIAVTTLRTVQHD